MSFFDHPRHNPTYKIILLYPLEYKCKLCEISRKAAQQKTCLFTEQKDTFERSASFQEILPTTTPHPNPNLLNKWGPACKETRKAFAKIIGSSWNSLGHFTNLKTFCPASWASHFGQPTTTPQPHVWGENHLLRHGKKSPNPQISASMHETIKLHGGQERQLSMFKGIRSSATKLSRLDFSSPKHLHATILGCLTDLCVERYYFNKGSRLRWLVSSKFESILLAKPTLQLSFGQSVEHIP